MKWTIDDEKLLSKLYLINRKSTPEIAQIMSRDKGAVRAKITKMSLTSCVASKYIQLD
jgi:hypothetical protein